MFLYIVGADALGGPLISQRIFVYGASRHRPLQYKTTATRGRVAVAFLQRDFEKEER